MPKRWTNKLEVAGINAVIVVIIADNWGPTGNNGDGYSTDINNAKKKDANQPY